MKAAAIVDSRATVEVDSTTVSTASQVIPTVCCIVHVCVRTVIESQRIFAPGETTTFMLDDFARENLLRLVSNRCLTAHCAHARAIIDDGTLIKVLACAVGAAAQWKSTARAWQMQQRRRIMQPA